MFGRRRQRAEPAAEYRDDLSWGDKGGGAAEFVGAAPDAPATGPWDSAQVPPSDVNRLDLGGLLIPVLPGAEIRVDVEQESGQVVSVTLATASSSLQVLAFAAPRSTGIWSEIRAEIADSINGGGGRAQMIEGQYGPEIVADVPTDKPGELAAARFVGVDGPRWFLRALAQGEAARTPSAEPVLWQAFAEVVVVRGEEAMAVRDQLPLRLPKEAIPSESTGTADLTGSADSPEAADPEPRPSFLLPERGPENTETR